MDYTARRRVSLNKASQLFGVSRYSLTLAIAAEELPASRLKGRRTIYVLPEDVETLLRTSPAFSHGAAKRASEIIDSLTGDSDSRSAA